jgi:aspartyl-tRNA(Asn)/glutamyl-tRNA(Gln) amidotransferase subunit A
MTNDEIAFLAITELGSLLRKGELSPVELTKLYLERLESIGRDLRLVVTVTHDIALREAALAEAELRSGLDRGPLHGIPYGLKDIVAAVGAPTTWGAAPFKDQTFKQEATIVRKLRNAGAVLVAKLATIEIAGGMGYDNPNASTTGAALNPWDASRWTSGSSSGPAGAVAAAAVPFAIGSDTSGSILFPAAFTGTAGLRATYGRVSRFGAMTLCWTLDRLGPMCRSADDCGLVLEAIAGHDPSDPSSLNRSYQYQHRTVRRTGFRFGVIEGSCDGADPEVHQNFQTSLQILREVGTLEEVRLPEYPYAEVAQVITAAEAYAAFDDFIAAGRNRELTAKKAHAHRLAGAVLPAHDYIRAQRIRRIIAESFNDLARQYDALVAPSLGVVACEAAEDFEYGLPRASSRPLNLAGVLAGTPTISVFNGLGQDELPTGMQFAGAALQENSVLDAAHALEKRLGLSRLRPKTGAGPLTEPRSRAAAMDPSMASVGSDLMDADGSEDSAATTSTDMSRRKVGTSHTEWKKA